MIPTGNNPLIQALQIPEILTLKSQDDTTSCLFDSRGVYVKINQITQHWLSQEKQLCLTEEKKISIMIKVCRRQYAFGNISLANEIKLLVKVEKIYERKSVFGWRDNKKESQASRGYHEERINRDLNEYIQNLVQYNSSILSTIRIPFDNMRFACNENGKLEENGKYGFIIEQHLFKPLGMSETLSFYGWSTDLNDTRAAAFLRYSVIAETVTAFAKHHHQLIFCKELEESERIGLSPTLAAETHPTKLYGISPRLGLGSSMQK